ncbi:MAG TPA: glutathione S-transferase family protein [Rhizomicrobium sp.]|jgi:glutathione S-transferase|nr:glutathione S-transferase family protein [Rhizomicrobium sp.]
MITIHNFARGARGVRLFWVCEEMGLAYTAQTVSYPPSAAYRALNPLGSVPFLEDGGVAINESTAIMLYLAERYGPTPLLPPPTDAAAHARVLQMTIFGEASLGAALNALLIDRFAAPEGQKGGWIVGAMEGRAAQMLDYVAGIMGGNPYLAGDNFTLADISVACAIDMWHGALGKPVPDAFADWRTRLQARPAYRRALAAQTR